MLFISLAFGRVAYLETIFSNHDIFFAMRFLATKIKESGIDVNLVLPVITEGLRMERLHRDAQKLLGNQKEYLNSELKIAQAELFLNLLRFNQ